MKKRSLGNILTEDNGFISRYENIPTEDNGFIWDRNPTNLAPSHHLFFKASSKQAKHNLDNIHSSCPVNKSTPLGNSRAGHEQSHARSTAERE
nr:hypothetical protein BgiMline_015458 [Biomphalaria glabrata]